MTVNKPDLDNAKNLWKKANAMLEKENITEYLKAANELIQFMKDSNLKEDDLRDELSDVAISPKAYAILQQIFSSASTYSRESSTLVDSSVETGLASAVNKMSAFFLDCKLNKNERVKPDPDFKLTESHVLVSIMQFIKEVATPESKIGLHSTKALMTYKIAAINKLERSNNSDQDSLDNVLRSKGEELSEYLSYQYATTNRGRFHLWSVDTKNINEVKEQYKGLRGDELKTSILINFKNILAEATDEKSLDELVETLKKSDEYKILSSNQNILSRMFQSKTTSVCAFEKLVEEAKEVIQCSQNVNKI